MKFEKTFYPVTREFTFVGTAAAARPRALKETIVPDYLNAVMSDFPEFEKLRYPRRTAEETQFSLATTYAKGQHGGFKEYAPFEEQFVVDQMQFDDAGPEPPDWVREFRLPTPREVLAKVAQLSDDSNAGYPYCLLGAPKRTVALANFQATYNAVCERLLKLASEDDAPLDPVELVVDGWVDPMLAVEKDEPFDATRKTARSIIMGSVVDELIDRLLTDEHDNFELDHYGEYFSASGIGFSPEHHDYIVECVSDMEERVREGPLPVDYELPMTKSDVSGFDTNCFEEEAATEAVVVLRRFRIFGNSPVPWRDQVSALRGWRRYFARMVLNRARVSFRSLIVFGDGTLWKQTTRGGQKSGVKRTTARNTNMRRQKFLRCVFRALAGRDLGLGWSPTTEAIVAEAKNQGYDPRQKDWWRADFPSLGVGDDMVEPNYPGLRQNYQNTNVRIKEGSFQPCSSLSFEFCSHVWGQGQRNPRPLNAGKAAFRLLCSDPQPDKYVIWAMTYWYASDKDKYINLFRRLAYPVGKNNKRN